MTDYFALLVLFGLAVIFVIVILLLSIFLGPKRYSEVKDDPFECGTLGTGGTDQRFSVKFYVVAMIFIIFDVEVVFLYPWAVELAKLGWSGFFAAVPFLFLLAVGLAYEWKRGVLDWT